MSKYYWVVYWRSVYSKPHRPVHIAIKDEHPIEWIIRLQEFCYENNFPKENTELILTYWTEITKEQYNLYQEHTGGEKDVS